MTAENFEHYLPLVDSVKHYGARRRVHQKPLFPGYVFARVHDELKARIYQQELLVRAIPVDDEKLLLRQLDEVKLVLASGVELAVHPLIKKGARVKITGGPLRGLEGVIDDPAHPKGIVIAVDVLQQGLLIRMPLSDLRALP